MGPSGGFFVTRQLSDTPRCLCRWLSLPLPAGRFADGPPDRHPKPVDHTRQRGTWLHARRPQRSPDKQVNKGDLSPRRRGPPPPPCLALLRVGKGKGTGVGERGPPGAGGLQLQPQIPALLRAKPWLSAELMRSTKKQTDPFFPPQGSSAFWKGLTDSSEVAQGGETAAGASALCKRSLSLPDLENRRRGPSAPISAGSPGPERLSQSSKGKCRLGASGGKEETECVFCLPEEMNRVAWVWYFPECLSGRGEALCAGSSGHAAAFPCSPAAPAGRCPSRPRSRSWPRPRSRSWSRPRS